MNVKSPLLLVPILLLTAFPAAGQNFQDDLDGVNWSKTLRVRGIISRFDPFNETALYRIGSEGKTNEISARADLVQFEMIASGFWGVLRDSLEQALSAGRLNVYTLGFPRTGNKVELRVRRTRVTYEDLLDSISTAFGNFVPPNDRLIQIYDPEEGNVTGMSRLVERMRSQSRTKRIVQNLRLFSVFELELAISVDETGFKIKPTGLIMGTSHWTSEGEFDRKNILGSTWYTGYDTSDPRNPKNIGFYVDLTEPKTMKWLIENGMQVSGERNIVPFYDLLTLFHYQYKIYAESNNVLAIGAQSFGDKYQLPVLEKTLLDRYNDMMYQYLYGQAPEWWDQGKRGAFTNGMFELDSLRQKKAAEEPPAENRAGRGNAQPENEPAEAKPAAGGRGGRGGQSGNTGTGGTSTTGRKTGGNNSGNTTTTAKPAEPAPKKQTDSPPPSSRRRRGGGGG